MASEIPRSQIRQAQFRTVLRGLDRGEVEAFVERVAARVDELETEVNRLRKVAEQAASPDLENEFEVVGHEVSTILQAAREAAEAMRERASTDAARWRSEALAEAEGNRREAAADAEALRRDAWVTGTELLDRAASEARRMREQAERDVLTVMGEAEREAHRLTSAARREAEDVMRNAAMAAEKITVEAEHRRDDLIEAANRQAASAQERARALEQRRDELMNELESIRSTLSKLEGSLEERRDLPQLAPEPEESTSVKVVPAPTSGGEKPWELGETVRVVPGESRIPKVPGEQKPVQESGREPEPEPMPEPEPEPTPLPEPEPMPEPEPEPTPLPEPEPMPEPEPKPQPLPEPEPGPVPEPVAVEDTEMPIEEHKQGGDVDSLFASLRGKDAGSPAPVAEESEVEDEAQAPTFDFDGHDWIEDRDARLLPITNRALRGTKRAITELQNIALDQLRTDDRWRPDPKVFAETLGADLIALWAESFAAGHAVAEEMTGTKLKRPPTPHSEAVAGMSDALADSLSKVLDDAGEGQRERQSAASRVFRVWRSDEAEQRLRELAIRAYQEGVERSVASAEG